MAYDNTRFITIRRSTVVRVAIAVAVLAVLGIGLAVGVSVGSSSSPPAKSAGATSTTSQGSATTTTVVSTTTTVPLPAVLSCGPKSTPHLLPTRLKVGCATGNVTVTAIVWKSWEADTGGQGTGTLNMQSGTSLISVPAVVVVFGVVNGVFQDVSIVPTSTLTTTTTTTTITATPTTPTPGGPSPVIASQPGSGWGSD